MHSTFRAVLAGGVLALLLAACGGSKNEKGIDYMTPGADPVKPSSLLLVPPDLITPMRDERYVVPDGGARSTATYSGYVASQQPATAGAASAASAPTASANPAANTSTIRMLREGDQRRLVVKADKESVWPKLQDFWRNYGFVLVLDDLRTGIQETEWASNRARLKGNVWQEMMSKALGSFYSSDEQDKFRLRVEATSQPGVIEIYISQRGMLEIMGNGTSSNSGTTWAPRPRDPELEAAMLQRLMVSLGTDEKVAAQQMVATQEQGAEAEHAKLSNGADGALQLTVMDSLDRSWRQVGLALDRVGLVVEDRDRAKGIYFVRYVVINDPTAKKKDGGWLSSLAFWSSKPEPGTDQFQIAVTGDDKLSTVRVLDKSGVEASNPSTKQILTTLHGALK